MLYLGEESGFFFFFLRNVYQIQLKSALEISPFIAFLVEIFSFYNEIQFLAELWFLPIFFRYSCFNACKNPFSSRCMILSVTWDTDPNYCKEMSVEPVLWHSR